MSMCSVLEKNDVFKMLLRIGSILSTLSIAAGVATLVFASKDTRFESGTYSVPFFHVPLGLSAIFPSVFEVSLML